MRKIKVVVLLVQQLQHGFTKNAKVSPNLTVTHLCMYGMFNLNQMSGNDHVVLDVIFQYIRTLVFPMANWSLPSPIDCSAVLHKSPEGTTGRCGNIGANLK